MASYIVKHKDRKNAMSYLIIVDVFIFVFNALVSLRKIGFFCHISMINECNSKAETTKPTYSGSTCKLVQIRWNLTNSIELLNFLPHFLVFLSILFMFIDSQIPIAGLKKFIEEGF